MFVIIEPIYMVVDRATYFCVIVDKFKDVKKKRGKSLHKIDHYIYYVFVLNMLHSIPMDHNIASREYLLLKHDMQFVYY